MELRALGRTGLQVSAIGFGTWGLGGDVGGAIAYGPTDDAESIAAVSRASDLGVTFFDTADLYGFGHAERLLGRVFGKRRADVCIASKVGFVDRATRQDFSQGHIERALDASLDRLQTGYLDVYLLHSPELGELGDPRPLRTLLERLVSDGRIRSWGIALRSPSDARLAVEAWGAPCVELNLNLCDQRAVDEGTLALCERQGVGVIARSPLSLGFLTGRAPASFHPNDHRRRFPEERVERWRAAGGSFAAALAWPGATMTQNALRFCLSFDAVSTVIPGMVRVTEVEENVAAAGLPRLTPEVLASVHATYVEFTGDRS